MHKSRPLLAVFCVFTLLAAGTARAKTDWKKLGEGVKKARELRNELHLGRDNEEALGREVAAYLVARHGLVQEEDLTRYVSLVGRTLARHAKRSDLDWRFGILDTDAVNAYATPGGRIFVTAGLIDKLSNEAQLAGVLAHEIVHVDDKHAIKGFVKAKALGMLGKKLADKHEFDAIAEKLIEGIAHKGFPRADEYAADKRAIRLVRAAGYNAYGLSAALQRLYGKKKVKLTESFHSRHPSLSSRKQRLKKILKGVPSKEGRTLGRRYRGHTR
jgi:predicted Zn-dependent protease